MTRASSSPRASRRSVVLVGASITGNRGAESMLRASLERLGELLGDVEFTLLSLYPAADRAENEHQILAIVPFSPRRMVLQALPTALAVGAARRFGVEVPRSLLPQALRAVADADLVVDLSGISFVDGRGIGILLYNVILSLMPALLGTRTMKFAQAMGPFETFINRSAARFCLPHVDRIAARGRVTADHLRTLGIPQDKVIRCADAAFVMDVSSKAQREADAMLEAFRSDRPLVAVSASSVVDDYCARQGVSYAALMAEFIDGLVMRKDRNVLLLAHSARPFSSKTKNSDLPICRAIHRRLRRADACLFPDGAHHADLLRALIGRCRTLVASRFHAMISGLAMTVPSLLIGWSHKYAEVLEEFGMEDFAIDYARVDLAELERRYDELDARADELRERIAERLPSVRQAALRNMQEAAALILGPGA